MESGTILRKEPSGSPKRIAPVPELGWYLLGWAGWVFLLAGLVDIGLAWVPFHLGNPEWEFGTITQSLQSLPVPFLGAALIIAAGIARGRLWWGALWVIVSGVLYALNVPLALRAVKQPQILFGLKKAIFRTALQVGLYAIAASGMAWLGMRALKAAGRAVPESR